VPDNVSADETWFRNLARRKISRTKEKGGVERMAEEGKKKLAIDLTKKQML
jgi:hypothetical protein